MKFSQKITGKNIVFFLDHKFTNKNVDIMINNEYLLTANVSKKSEIKIKKVSKLGKIIQNAINFKDKIDIILAKS